MISINIMIGKENILEFKVYFFIFTKYRKYPNNIGKKDRSLNIINPFMIVALSNPCNIKKPKADNSLVPNPSGINVMIPTIWARARPVIAIKKLTFIPKDRNTKYPIM